MIDLLGDWRFEGSTLTDSAGNSLADPMNKGSGILMYSANGYMAAQLSTSAPMTTPEVNLTSAYIAYYGKYVFDEKSQVVTHEVIDSNLLPLVGKRVQRKVIAKEPGLIFLQNVEPETFGIDRPVFRKLLWRLV